MEIQLTREEVKAAIESYFLWQMVAAGKKVELITATDTAGYRMDFPTLIVSLGDKEATDGGIQKG